MDDETSKLNRRIPPCPNTEDLMKHAHLDEVHPNEEMYYTFNADKQRWEPKSHWLVWAADPIAVIVNSFDPWGEAVQDGDLEGWERDGVLDIEYGVQLGLKDQDNQDILQCSVCKAEFTCDEDMNLHPTVTDDGNTKWVIL